MNGTDGMYYERKGRGMHNKKGGENEWAQWNGGKKKGRGKGREEEREA